MNLEIKQKHKKWNELSFEERALYTKAMQDFIWDRASVEEIATVFSYNGVEVQEVLS